MPIYKILKVNASTTVYIWNVVESEAALAENVTLTNHCQNRMKGMKSELHRRAFLSIRHLMAEAGYVDADLYYDEVGKPHLKDGNKISITHSNNFTLRNIDSSYSGHKLLMKDFFKETYIKSQHNVNLLYSSKYP